MVKSLHPLPETPRLSPLSVTPHNQIKFSFFAQLRMSFAMPEKTQQSVEGYF